MILKVRNVELLRLFELNVVGKSVPLMSQFTFIGILGFHFRLHRFYAGENKFHSHPRHFVSFCIAGKYKETMLNGKVREVKPGTLTIRKATDAHRVTPLCLPCWTIVVTSPVVNQWKTFEQ